jgi:hypothetical protein
MGGETAPLRKERMDDETSNGLRSGLSAGHESSACLASREQGHIASGAARTAGRLATGLGAGHIE